MRASQARQVGDRVALPWLGHACGSLPVLRHGLGERFVESQQNTGYSINGGLRRVRRCRCPVTSSLVPDGGRSAVDAAPLTCAGVTTYKAAKVAGIRPSETVLVSGIGGLGHLAIQYARLMSAAIVVAVDIEDSKLELARELGADHVVNAGHRGPGRKPSPISVAWTWRSRSPPTPPRSIRRSALCGPAAGWSASGCRPRVRSDGIAHFRDGARAASP